MAMSEQGIEAAVADIRRKHREQYARLNWTPVSWEEHGPDDHRRIADALPEFECLGWIDGSLKFKPK